MGGRDMRQLEELAAVPVLDPSGRESRLGETWSEGPTVLVFLRHFG